MEFLAGEYNFRVDAWTTARNQVAAVDTNNNPIDLTTYGQFVSLIKYAKTAPQSLVAFTVAVVDAPGGILELSLTAAQTGALWGSIAKLYAQSPTAGYFFLYWDVLGTAGAGDTKKLASGTFQLIATASH
jgi:hypothetical protein